MAQSTGQLGDEIALSGGFMRGAALLAGKRTRSAGAAAGRLGNAHWAGLLALATQSSKLGFDGGKTV